MISAAYVDARSYQKFFARLKGLFMGLRGRLPRIGQAVTMATGSERRWFVGRLGSAGRVKSMAKQVTITIETNSLVVLNARSSGRMWCPRCGTEGEVLRLNPRNSESEAGWEILQRLAARSDVHYQQTPDGCALICLNSLVSFVHDRLQSRGHELRAINTKVEEI